MPDDTIVFTWSDAWLLLAISFTSQSKPASLQDIIGAGDAINHAIFTDAELRRGLAKLIAAGYVGQQDQCYFVRGDAADFCRSKVKKARRLSRQRELVEKFLHATPWSRRKNP